MLRSDAPQPTLHIWQACLPEVKPYTEQLLALLSNEEQQRGQRFVNATLRHRFLLTYGVLRQVLSRYLPIEPSAITFYTGPHGKPYIADSDIQFNLSHSHDVIVIAITSHHEVGIDVEYIQSAHRFDDLVQRFFSTQERAEYFAYPSATRRLAFYRGWTRKEAYLKANGLGLSYPLHDFSVSLADNPEDHILSSVVADTGADRHWVVFSLRLGKNGQYMASVASQTVTKDFVMHLWKRPDTVEDFILAVG